MENAGEIEPGDDQASEIRDEGDGCVGLCGREGGAREDVARVGARGCSRDRIDRLLIGEFDVDKGGHGLHRPTLLRVFDKVSLTGLVFGIPIEDIKLRIVSSLCRRLGRSKRGGQVGKGSVLKLLVRVAVERFGEIHLGGFWGQEIERMSVRSSHKKFFRPTICSHGKLPTDRTPNK